MRWYLMFGRMVSGERSVVKLVRCGASSLASPRLKLSWHAHTRRGTA